MSPAPLSCRGGPAPNPRPRAQQPSVPLTLASPAAETHRPPPLSPPAHCHPQPSTGRCNLSYLDPGPTSTRIIPGPVPPPFTTGAHRARPVTKIEVLLRFPYLVLWTRQFACLQLRPPPTFCIPMRAVRWVADHLGMTGVHLRCLSEVLLRCLLINQYPALSLEILPFSGNLVRRCSYLAFSLLKPTKSFNLHRSC